MNFSFEILRKKNSQSVRNLVSDWDENIAYLEMVKYSEMSLFSLLRRFRDSASICASCRRKASKIENMSLSRAA